jgi:hypothetical protein
MKLNSKIYLSCEMNKTIFSSLILIISIILGSCGDPVPSDYIPQNYIEGYLIVDQPIRKIIVMKTQPVTSTFSFDNAMIKDADVRILYEDKVLSLVLSDSVANGYYYPDTTLIVKPNTQYTLEIRLKDGTLISGVTNTPSRFDWVKQFPYDVYYPKDTLNLPVNDTLKMEWTKSTDVTYYIVFLRCLDTLNYGKYLIPQTNESNRRIYRPGENDDQRYYEISSSGLVPNTSLPMLWTSFKWFGKHEITVYAPDAAYLQWYLQHVVQGQYNPFLSNIQNGDGVFCSASLIHQEIFLYKNQP